MVLILHEVRMAPRVAHHIAAECRLRVFASAALGLTEVRGDLNCDEGGVKFASPCLLG